jgi:hypothetical protein
MENDINKQVTIVAPSEMTKEQLWREIASLKELLTWRIEGLDTKTENRAAAIEDSIKIAHDDLVRVPTEVQKQVGGLKELLFNKIDGRALLVDEKFTLMESARLEQKTNLLAAFTKSEQSFSKLIDQQGNLISTMSNGFNVQMDEIKKRLTTIEGIAIGALGQRTEKRGTDTFIIAMIGLVCAIIFGILGYILNK